MNELGMYRIAILLDTGYYRIVNICYPAGYRMHAAGLPYANHRPNISRRVADTEFCLIVDVGLELCSMNTKQRCLCVAIAGSYCNRQTSLVSFYS